MTPPAIFTSRRAVDRGISGARFLQTRPRSDQRNLNRHRRRLPINPSDIELTTLIPRALALAVASIRPENDGDCARKTNVGRRRLRGECARPHRREWRPAYRRGGRITVRIPGHRFALSKCGYEQAGRSRYILISRLKRNGAGWSRNSRNPNKLAGRGRKCLTVTVWLISNLPASAGATGLPFKCDCERFI